MKCPKCSLKMKSQGVIDDNWRVYKCQCGYKAMKHIHPIRLSSISGQ